MLRRTALGFFMMTSMGWATGGRSQIEGLSRRSACRRDRRVYSGTVEQRERWSRAGLIHHEHLLFTEEGVFFPSTLRPGGVCGQHSGDSVAMLFGDPQWIVADQISRSNSCNGSHAGMLSAQLKDRVFVNELTDPVNENTHLGREMAVLRIHHRDGVLLYRPVRKHRHELSRVQVGSNDVDRRLYDSKTVEPGGNIGLMIIDCEDTVESQHNSLSITCELPVEDSSRPVRHVVDAAMGGQLICTSSDPI